MSSRAEPARPPSSLISKGGPGSGAEPQPSCRTPLSRASISIVAASASSGVLVLRSRSATRFRGRADAIVIAIASALICVTDTSAPRIAKRTGRKPRRAGKRKKRDDGGDEGLGGAPACVR